MAGEGFLEQLLRLAESGGEEQDEGAGLEVCTVHGEQGGHGGLAGLAAAVEQDAVGGAAEHLPLPGIWIEPHTVGEPGGVEPKGEVLGEIKARHGKARLR